MGRATSRYDIHHRVLNHIGGSTNFEVQYSKLETFFPSSFLPNVETEDNQVTLDFSHVPEKRKRIQNNGSSINLSVLSLATSLQELRIHYLKS